MLNIHPDWTREALKDEVITGKATDIDELVIPVKIKPTLIVAKMR
jgi:hypothetical protein